MQAVLAHISSGTDVVEQMEKFNKRDNEETAVHN